MRALLALLLIVAALWVLERDRAGLSVSTSRAGTTPVTAVERPGADGPFVVVAHGFAGSRQMMLGYAVPLAKAGYRVRIFDFLGHGRNTAPMTGDVNSVTGTTERLVQQTEAVLDALPETGSPVALLGHSMATDILVRVAERDDRTGPLVLVSAFSQQIDGMHPRALLLVSGS